MRENRDKRGRFTAGNKAAKGNPYARKAAEMRSALYSSVSREDVCRIAAALKKQAIKGDLKAISLLLDRLLGPAQVGIDLLERLENLETTMLEAAKETKRGKNG